MGSEAAGFWYAYPHSTGNPSAMTLGAVGTALAWHPAHDRLAGSMPIGGDVSPDTKHIINASAFSAVAASVPKVLMLVDMLGWYPMTNTTLGGDQALVNSRTFTATAATPTVVTLAAGWDMQTRTCIRLTNSGGALPADLLTGTNYYWNRLSATTGNLALTHADLDNAVYVAASGTGTGTHTATMYIDRSPTPGAGVQAFITPSVALGAGTPNIRITYTDADGNPGALTPATLPISNASSPIGQVDGSGTAAGKFGPFLPLAAGDKGMRLAEQFNYSATHASGTANLILARPLLTLPLTTVGVAGERDLLNQVPSLPRVFDGSCLVWLGYAGAVTTAGSSYFGHLDFGWG